MRRRRHWFPFVSVLAMVVVVSSIAGVSGTGDKEAAPARDTVLLPIGDPAPSAPAGGGKDRIINGTKASPLLDDAARWRSISLLISYDGSSVGMCGATFVTRRALVTAAHCVTEDGVQKPASQLFVTNGRTDVAEIFKQLRAGKKPNALPTLLTPVTSVAVHPSWNEAEFSYDAAVLQVATDSRYAPTLMTGAGEPGTWGGGNGRDLAAGGAFIAGWGDTDYSYKTTISEQLVEAAIPIHSDRTCNDQRYGFLPESMICAGTLDTDGSYETSNGVDTCQGDSGGPLLAAAADGTMRLVGITSFGSTCASEYSAGVYTRVDAVRSWVEGITGPASGTGSFPVPAVAGGGGAGAALAVVSPTGGTRVGATGATNVAWTLPFDKDSYRVALFQGSSTYPYWSYYVERDATSYLLGHANVKSGTSRLCVETLDDLEACVVVSKGSTGPKALAQVQSATLRGGRLTLRGRVAASTRVVQVKVLVTAGRTKLKSRTMRLRMKAFPRSTSFTTTMRWRGATPKRLKVVTQVKVGAKWRSFTSTLR